MNTITIYDILIIGGGPAGLYSAYYSHLKGLNAFLVESSSILGGQPLNLYSQKQVHDFATYSNIKGYEIAKKLINQFNESKTPYLLNTSVKKFKWDDQNKYFKIVLTNKQVFLAKNIIVAIGTGFLTPNKIITEHDTNIQYFVEPFVSYNNLDVVMAGGGDSAIDWSNEILQNAKVKSFTIIHRKPEFRANGQLVNKLMHNPKVTVLLDKTINVVEPNTIQLINNSDFKTKDIHFDKLIVQYGHTIDLHLNYILKEFKCNENNKIIVDDLNITNIQHAYAIGTVAHYPHKPNLIITSIADAIKVIDHILFCIKKYEQ